MAVFTGRRTRRQIIDQALVKAGNTKILVEARIELARILEALYLEHEWPFLYAETTLTLVASTALPTDFLKVEASDTGLRGTAVDGEVEDFPVQIVTPTEWRRQAIPRAETAERPEIAMIDYASSTLKPWPIPDGTVTALLVYKRLPAEVDPASVATYDADVPLFPFHGYLTDRVEEWALGYEKDYTGAQLKNADNARGLSMLLGTAIPKDANQAASLELDPALFRTPPRYNEE